MQEKPTKGTATRARRAKSRARRQAESAIMAEARHRDDSCCRHCGSRDQVEVAHVKHRGMGGNPAMDRTHLAGLVTLCALHHREVDAKRLKMSFGPDGANGPIVFKR